MDIRISYFALLREHAGKNEEIVKTDAKTAHDLYNELAKRYGFTLNTSYIKFVINDVFASSESVLKSGDHVIFVLPVAGG